MSKGNPRVLVKLWCGHFTYWSESAVHNDARTCPTCRSVEACEDYWHTEWGVRCGYCRFARYFGLDEGAAVEASRTHRHPTTVEKVSTEPLLRDMKDRQPEPEQGTLDLFPADTPPPF